MTREEVLAQEADAWSELMQAIHAVPAALRGTPGVVPDWSTHDVVWHTAYWVGYGATAVELIRGGQPEPRDEDATAAENAVIADTGRTMSWAAVMRHLEQRRTTARESLNAFAGVVPERALEFFADYTTGHYLEHAPQIRTFAQLGSRVC